MEKKGQKQLEDNFIDQKLAEAFGYQDEQLAEELDAVAAEAGDDLPRAPGGELQKIMDRLEREESARASGRRVVRMRKMVKVLVAAAVLGTMVIGGSMWVGAKKYYTYELREDKELDNVVVFDNNPNNLVVNDNSEEQKAYKRIEEELNIEVLELSYLPKGMNFDSLTMWKSRGLMRYVNGDLILFFFQGWNDKSASLSYNSDMRELKVVYNSFLDKEIPVYQKELENGYTEYSVRITDGNKYYFLNGNIGEIEFCQIVQNMKLREK